MRYQTIILSLIFVILGSEVNGNNSYFKIKESFHASSEGTLGGNPSSIPIVFIVSSNSSIDEIQILDQLEKINQIFDNSSTCTDYNFTSPIPIQFCVATRDIDKNPSDGVVLLSDQFSIFDTCEDEFDLKFSHRMMNDMYPTSSYLNIYLVDDICASCENYGCAAGGYATLPSSHGSIMDGIILELDTWLGDCDDTKTIVHELGHYFGLYHTFEGGCKNDNCLEDGDKVCDTPPQFLEVITNDHICLQGMNNNSCSTDVNPMDASNPFSMDQNDLDNNIMNYVPLSCQESLTPGQIERMEAVLCNERVSLLDSKGCLAPCNQNIDLLLDVPDAAFIEQLFIITNNSTNATSYLWEVDGQQFNTDNLSYTFQQTGTYTIELIASNNEEGCNESISIDIIVECFEQPIISSDNLLIDESDILNLTVNNEDSEINYTWYAGDSIIGIGTAITYTSNFSGPFSISVNACNDDCCQTSNILHLVGGSCPPDNGGDLWIYGRDGIVLNFESGNPIEEPNLFNGDFINDFSSSEPSTIQLDQNGNLLFYSNANKIWNRNHEIMMNGDILGSTSSSQMLSLRQPGSSHLYYVFSPFQNFTTTSPTSLIIDSTRTIHFSIIDMNLDGGLGAVSLLDQKLLDFGPEKISAIRHCNGIDWWIITHPCGGNEFHTFLLSEDGLSLSPITSQIGGFQPFQKGKIGFLKFSHDGKLMAHTYIRTGNVLPPDTLKSNLELFTFDNSSGTVTSLIFQDSTFNAAYGIEFSPDNSKLYLADVLQNFVPNRLYQYDLRVLEQQEIMDSKYLVNTQPERLGALQLGKDGKIYSTYFDGQDLLNSMQVIQSPNLRRELCNFIPDAFPLQYGDGFLGLPNFPGRVYRQEYPEIEGIDSVNICTDSILTYRSFGRCTTEDYQWDLIGQNTLLQTTGDSVEISFHTKSIDTLLLTRTTACGMYTDSFPILIDDCNFQCDLAFDWVEIDTLICEGESPTLHYSPISQDLSVNGILQNSYSTRIDLGPIATDTCLSISIVENYECDSSFQICITVDEPLSYAFDNEIALCYGNTALVNLQTDADIIELINLETDSILFPINGQLFTEIVTDTLEYYVRLARFVGNCDTYLPLLVYPDAAVYTESRDTLFCVGDSLTVMDSVIIAEGIYNFELLTQDGCDSLLILEAEFYDLPTIDTSYLDVCTVQEIDTTYIPNSTVEGCSYNDVVITVLLELDTTFVQDIICSSLDPLGDTLIVSNVIGCDSVIVYQYDYIFDTLTYIGTIDTTICVETSVEFVDSIISFAGQYDLLTTAFDGCDSIIQVNLQNYTSPIPDTTYLSTCDINQVDTLIIPMQTVNGCAYNDLQIINFVPLDTTFIEEMVCNSNSNEYDTLMVSNSMGCDSVIVLNNIFNFDSTLFFETIDTIVCPGTNIIIDDSIFLLPGTYELGISSAAGCDSIVSIDLKYFEVPNGDTIVNYTCKISEIDTILSANISPDGCEYNDVSIIAFVQKDTSFLIEYECEEAYENDTVVLSNVLGCDSLVITEFILNAIDVSVQIEDAYIESSQINLEVENQIGGVIYNWYLDSILVCEDCVTFSFEAEYDQKLEVEAVNESDCTSNYVGFINVENSTKIKFANVFSPNGDQINDTFFPIGTLEEGTIIDEFKIFDRWGSLVHYETNIDINDATNGWNGTYKGSRCLEGVYVFQLTFTTPTNVKEFMIGDVALVR